MLILYFLHLNVSAPVNGSPQCAACEGLPLMSIVSYCTNESKKLKQPYNILYFTEMFSYIVIVAIL